MRGPQLFGLASLFARMIEVFQRMAQFVEVSIFDARAAVRIFVGVDYTHAVTACNKGSSGFQVAKGFMLRAPQWK